MARTRNGTRRSQANDSSDSEEEPERNDSDDDNDDDVEQPEDGEDPENGDSGNDDDDDDSSDDDEQPGALTPGQATPGRVLKYTEKKAHDYLYRNATHKLDEELYDCVPDQFFQFMKSLEERANAFGWTAPEGILWVTRKDGTRINLLHSYGSISLGRITRHERTYWDNGLRPSQNDRMFYECIMSSLSMAGKARVNIHSEDYQLMSGNQRVPSGLCLLKIFVRESYLDSNATTGMIREQLSNLDLYMPTVNNDITRFNNHVKMLLQALHARNERTLDLLTYLFKAYAVCNDKEFTKFIGDVQTDHDMGTKRVDDKELMALAEKKFKIMKTLQKWEAPTQMDDQIMALQAKLTKLQDKLKRAGDKRKPRDTDKYERKKPKKEKFKKET